MSGCAPKLKTLSHVILAEAKALLGSHVLRSESDICNTVNGHNGLGVRHMQIMMTGLGDYCAEAAGRFTWLGWQVLDTKETP